LSAAGIQPLALARHELGDEIFEKLKEDYEAKEKILGAETMRYHERMVMLSVIDGLWKDHLLSMDHLKEGIGLRGYAQQDPLVAYKRESFDMFEAMMLKFQEDGPLPVPHADHWARWSAGSGRPAAATRCSCRPAGGQRLPASTVRGSAA
jgi:hypothetical protein